MKKILCFGDSNTYGYNPKNSLRYSISERWSGILSQNLADFEVIEKGCNNRTCFSNSINELNAIKILPKYLIKNFDIIILQIGINDLQYAFNTSLSELKNNLIKLIEIINKYNSKSEIIFLCPDKIDDCILQSNFSQLFDNSSISKSKELFKIFKEISNKTNAKIIYLSNIAKTSAIDGLHYNIENHKRIADVLIKYIIENYSNKPNSQPTS